MILESVILVALLLIDTVQSYVGIYRLGIPEANPLVSNLPPDVFLLVKLLATLAVGSLLFVASGFYERIRGRAKVIPRVMVLIGVLVYAVTVVNNFLVLYKRLVVGGG